MNNFDAMGDAQLAALDANRYFARLMVSAVRAGMAGLVRLFGRATGLGSGTPAQTP